MKRYWPLVLGSSVVAVTFLAHGGDILRGGAGANQSPSGAGGSSGSSAVQAQAVLNAHDAMARTAQAIEAVRAMQLAAQQATKSGPKNLGPDPNHAGQTLPDVPDGLQAGGLQVAAGATPGSSLWSGASLPTQSFAGSGRVNVKIKQTQSQALLNWQTFNVGGNTSLTFDQSAGGASSGKWIVFNKVNDPTGRPSQIIGSIQAAGQVYVINGNGIIFGGSSQVNVHTLVASALPINDNLVASGLLNNPDAQFLFSGLALPAGANGTPAAFTPPQSDLSGGRWGDVTVQAGAVLSSPASTSHVGGRVTLLGANVTNAGTIYTPDGQTILAAGLQIGMAAHQSSDPSLRGLDVYVGAVTDPASSLAPYAGTVTNSGLVESLRGNITLTGRNISVPGALNSSTSVSLNGSVTINASYGAATNTAYDPTVRPNDLPFLYSKTGSVELGAGSAISILPEYADTSTVAATELALKSMVSIRGLTIHLGSNATILAPNGAVEANAGEWDLVQTASNGTNRFVRSAGQVYLDRGALINVAGTTNANALLSDYILTLQLRGAELAGSPLQRSSIFRNALGTGASITVDLRRTGVYNDVQWVGTPLADLSGYLALIKRDVAQLTTAGGTVDLSAGSSVVMQQGAKIDVSAGWTNFNGGMVRTSRVVVGGHIFDIADATPNQVYDSIYTGVFTESHPRWGITQNFTVPFVADAHYEPADLYGAAAGQVSIAGAGVALDGSFAGNTVAGARQLRDGAAATVSDMPKTAGFSLSLTAEQIFVDAGKRSYIEVSPTPGNVTFQSDTTQTAASPFNLDANGLPQALPADRLSNVYLSPDLLTSRGFGNLSVADPDGRITVPGGVTLSTAPLGSVSLTAANVDVFGSISSPGGAVNITTFNISPTVVTKVKNDPTLVSPLPNANRGLFTLGAGASISTAGLIIDDRLSAAAPLSLPLVTEGGTVSINSFSASLNTGSIVDVSGGGRIDPNGHITYGNAGSISIKTGKDAELDDVVGGTIKLDGTLLGRSGATGGSLSLQALLLQVGGAALNAKSLVLQPDFFSRGGFTDFSLDGLGLQDGGTDMFLPAVYIAPGTVVEPVAESYVLVPHGGPAGALSTQVVDKPAGLRSPVSLSFNAPGVSSRIGGLLIRGHIFMGSGSLIKVDPQGAISFSGNTVALLGSVFAPGGSIDVKGSGKSESLLFADVTHALTTVYIGPQSVLSAAGTTVLQPDAYGRTIGEVLPGGDITLSGNIVAAKGSVLDVSGASAMLGYHPSTVNPLVPYVVPPTSGLTTPLYSLLSEQVQVYSNGGGIQLKGGEMMFVDSTLRGFAGGPTASGGTLMVSSGRYYQPNTIAPVLDTNLVVTQSSLPNRDPLPADGSAIGRTVLGPGGAALIARGYFAADSFLRGGFDSLALDGKVEFQGPVTISARNTLRVADGGILFADNNVHLVAPYIQLGQPFVAPVQPQDRSGQYPFTNVAPTFGAGRLTVDATYIDLGTLSFQNIGKAVLNAVNGDIRGNGIIDIAGVITLRAGQVYPTTLSTFSIFAYDYTEAGVINPGTIHIENGGVRNLPLSAGGTLSLYASVIDQMGTLRAPMGIINLGWDGAGTSPGDTIAGTAKPFPVTTSLVLGAGSVTSVSGVDPLTGKGIVVPYGTSDGTSWLDPSGFDITGGGLPEKAVNLSAGSVTTLAGSTIDLRGGGSLMAVQWVMGNGGPTDVLGKASANWNATASYVAGDLVTYRGVTYSARVSSTGVQPSISAYWSKVPVSYAVVPGYNFASAPYSPFDSFGDSSLAVGDRIFLEGSSVLPQGTYTLLPARYALLPGAVLVTPQDGIAMGTIGLPGGSSLVSGYRFNDLAGAGLVSTVATRFEVAPSSVVNARASYNVFSADAFLTAAAKRLNVDTPRLPGDSGYLLFQASSGMDLQGSVLSQTIANDGRGSGVDISAPVDFVISSSNAAAGLGTIVLNADVLSAFGAESLLIGGSRNRTSTGTNVTVEATSLTVDNAGSTLSAPDLALVSKGNLTIATGASIASSGIIRQAETFNIVGNGTLVRVSQDLNAEVIRTGTTSGSSPTLSINALATIKAGSLTFDSTANTVLDPGATLSASAFALSSGRISLVLDDQATFKRPPGLELTGAVLDGFANSSRLSLLSYSSIDIYGAGTIGSSSLKSLTLNAGEISGFAQSGGDVTIAADTLILGNKANVSSSGIVNAPSGSLTLNAGTIHLTGNVLSFDQFSIVNFNASSAIIGEGQGGVVVQNAATLSTPLLTGAAGAIRTFTAGGNLAVTSSGATTASPAGNLGSSLSLSGANVSVDTTISLPSGSLTVRSTSGDLAVSGQLDVGGTTQTIYDVTRYTDAGQIQLTADSGNVVLSSNSTVNVAANSGGGNAGTLAVSVAKGSFTADGTLLGSGAAGGLNGSFQLDTQALPATGALSAALTAASLTNQQSIRVRTGNVIVDGTALAHDFSLSADLGGITVASTGSINASGVTGGSIALASRGDLVLSSGSQLTVHGDTFDSAGKGGSVTLESGTQRDGTLGTGNVRIMAGATIDLSVASKVAGNEATPGSSAYQGQYSGTLHIRAPQNAAGTDLLVGSIDGTIIDASSIVVEGYRLYDLTPGSSSAFNATIGSATQTAIFNDAQTFLGATGTTTANYTSMTNRLLANNAALASVFVLAPGAEIINRKGDLSLGSVSSDTTSDWNLSTFRFGAKGAAGVLTLRASGNVNLFNALSDGFSPTLASSDPTWLWLARLTTQNPLLPVNAQSWSYRITAGADLKAADFHQVQAAGAGSVTLGKDGGSMAAPGGAAALTSSVISAASTGGGRGLYQVLRTGSGDIDITAKGSVQLLNQFASIYTAGTRVSDPTLGGLVDFISLSQVGGSGTLGADQQNYPALFSVAGGNISISSGADIARIGSSSSRELPNNWLYRRGSVGQDGAFSTTGFSTSIASTAWWVDFSNFFEGVGTLGGGNIVLNAGNNVTNVDAVAPTNARTSKGTASNPLAVNQTTLELGGGNVTVRAGNNIDAGVYYVERGHGILKAGGQITTNASRSPGLITSAGANAASNQNSWLPSTLFLGKGGFDVSAGGDVLLGPVANPFLLPTGLGNSFWNKTYFSTYSPDSFVNVSSLGGSVTLREGSDINNVFMPLLESWATTQQLLGNGTAAASQPWLRLAETSVSPFRTSVALMAPTLRATAYTGDINIEGNLTLAPSATGTVELLTRGAINGLQPVGLDTKVTPNSIAWVAARINLSDANPGALPGLSTPFAYQAVAGVSVGQADATRADFLTSVDQLFAETGATLGAQSSLQVEQTLHSAGLLHEGDTSPLRLYAGSGDISGLTLFSPKAVAVHAGRDLSDVSFYVQNLNANDVSLITSGRDILPYDPNSLLRLDANRSGNAPIEGYALAGSGPLAGDLQINGPGTLEVLAGRNIDLGAGTNNADGTGSGITSIGNARNPYLPFQGASVVAGAGLGPAFDLSSSALDFNAFINQIAAGPNGARYLSEAAAAFSGNAVATLSDLRHLSGDAQTRIALELFFIALRDAGRDHNLTSSPGFGNYAGGQAAIQALFGSGTWSGDILTHERDIRTRSGGDISILVPGGSLSLAQQVSRDSLIPPGIITESGGSINIFANGNVNLGVSRIFTLRGGDIMIWSSTGNIAAGASSKTVQSAPPTRVLIDPSSADVTTDLAGLATGGGIGVLATVAGVAPGSVDLIAPLGVIDAGDAGIRATGNLNLAAVSVLNASNISVGGTSSGAPAAPVVSAPNIGGLTATSNAAASTNAAATAAAPEQQPGKNGSSQLPNIITVEVLGYGGGDDDDEEARKKKH